MYYTYLSRAEQSYCVAVLLILYMHLLFSLVHDNYSLSTSSRLSIKCIYMKQKVTLWYPVMLASFSRKQQILQFCACSVFGGDIILLSQ